MSDAKKGHGDEIDLSEHEITHRPSPDLPDLSDIPSFDSDRPVNPDGKKPITEITCPQCGSNKLRLAPGADNNHLLFRCSSCGHVFSV